MPKKKTGCMQHAGYPSSQEHSLINVDIIFPCTAKHISKYSQQKKLIVQETAQKYKTITKPHIDAMPEGALAWVYNILEKKKEVERLLFEDSDPDTGFMLHPDLKWDQTQVPDSALTWLIMS
jgi:m7GpppX diphosphatase